MCLCVGGVGVRGVGSMVRVEVVGIGVVVRIVVGMVVEMFARCVDG